MIVEKVILKSKLTGLEVIARYSNSYDYRLSVGESCYTSIIEYNGIEYIICRSKEYKLIYNVTDLMSSLLNYPVFVNRVTRLIDGYNIARDSVKRFYGSGGTVQCFDFDRSALEENPFDAYALDDDDDMCHIDFELTERNWGKDKHKPDKEQ